jgi:N-acetylglucosamine kinase
MRPLILAVDGGQTGTRALLAEAGGRVLGRGESGPIRHLFGAGGEEAHAAIRSAIYGAHADAGIEPTAVAAAVCGVTSIRPGRPEAAKVEAAVRSVVTPRRVEVLPDYVINLLGAGGGSAGVVVVAGGGSIAYGRADDGRQATAGGDGYLLGDEGSGYDIGRGALRAVLRAADGRAEPTTLTGRLLDAFAVSDAQDIKDVIYAPSFARDRIAALAPLVAEAAAAGDSAAMEILARAGEALALMALAVIRRLFSPRDSVSVYLTGGVFRAERLVTGSFERALRPSRQGVEIRAPQNPPVVGALLRASQLVCCISSDSSVHIC